MGHVVQSDEMPLQTQLVVEPFEKWVIYFIGLINPPSQKNSHILLCIEYITTWMEERPLSAATKQVVENFLHKEIFITYGIPREIVTYGGAQFTSKNIKNITELYHIKHRITMPYHPHANG
jgi:hypothetical protein